jgi:predicted secreted Zn-dependent protease
VGNNGVNKWDYLGLKLDRYVNGTASINYFSKPKSLLGGFTSTTKYDVAAKISIEPVEGKTGCSKLEVTGKLDIAIYINQGHRSYGTVLENDAFGQNFETHERYHEKIRSYFWNDIKSNIDGVDGEYCSKCAVVVKKAVKAIIKIGQAQSDELTARYEGRAYANMGLNQSVFNQLAADILNAQQRETEGFTEANEAKQEWIQLKCKKGCP